MFKKDLIGQQFNRLLVVREEGCIWICQCICGNFVRATSDILIHGRTKSCGCLRKKAAVKTNVIKQKITHRKTYTKEYCAWQNLKKRCKNPV